jgi:hypothetical protein
LGHFYALGGCIERRLVAKAIPQVPVLQALVLAERVWEIEGGRKVIGGTFNRVWFGKKPQAVDVETEQGKKAKLVTSGFEAGPPWAYLSLTDVCNNTRIELQFVSLTRNRVHFSTAVVIECHDRLATVEIVIPLPHLNIREEGVYAFEVVCEGEVIGSHRITAKQRPETP